MLEVVRSRQPLWICPRLKMLRHTFKASSWFTELLIHCQREQVNPFVDTFPEIFAIKVEMQQNSKCMQMQRFTSCWCFSGTLSCLLHRTSIFFTLTMHRRVEGSRRLALNLAANWQIAMLPWWKYKPRVPRGTAFFGLAQRIFPRKHSFDLPGEGGRWFLKDRWIMMDHRIIVFRNGGMVEYVGISLIWLTLQPQYSVSSFTNIYPSSQLEFIIYSWDISNIHAIL